MDLMNEEQITSWIFLALALASQTKPTDINGISMVADGINHAVPTQEQLQASISWLTNHDLIEKAGNKFKLTEKGKLLSERASNETNILLAVWKNLELEIKNLLP
ncbi:hypothetical protein I5M27_14120 [Adhaeribacter sp. BT258]|uniref:Uncharacterized protein n=1 Tax=Adhaeribacter terrigena TaxID=2793070 RepID=A0ABS1C3Z3_9BACT|nr:hypothetical protein [Adhaeribacter terrigena]MBK0404127.1 hypothetical protein [Adhaeribacter terrigena]